MRQSTNEMGRNQNISALSSPMAEGVFFICKICNEHITGLCELYRGYVGYIGNFLTARNFYAFLV